MDETTKAVNAHREALGRPPLAAADKRDLLLVEACAQYGMDRWQPGILEHVLKILPDAEFLAMLEEGDPDCNHSHIGSFADVWREAKRRGL